MYDSEVKFINEAFYADEVLPDQLDKLLERGWRHFGTHFFRYSYGFYELDIREVIPLRIRLEDFSLSKSQRRILRRNADLRIEVRPISITPEAEELFHRHKSRFKNGIPDSLYDFLSTEANSVPCEAKQISAYEDNELIAVSYFDIGDRTCSGVYATFDPKRSDRSLGIFTMLKEIEFAVDNRKQFYYQGYSFSGNSFYDYKRRFRGTEGYNWREEWIPLKEWRNASVYE
jgi:arginyl-tRNA--protein-N-Asp/Glu arginylyltransferase